MVLRSQGEWRLASRADRILRAHQTIFMASTENALQVYRLLHCSLANKVNQPGQLLRLTTLDVFKFSWESPLVVIFMLCALGLRQGQKMGDGMLSLETMPNELILSSVRRITRANAPKNLFSSYVLTLHRLCCLQRHWYCRQIWESVKDIHEVLNSNCCWRISCCRISAPFMSYSLVMQTILETCVLRTVYWKG